MVSESLKLARLAASQANNDAIASVLKEPLTQALIVWIVVEYLQKNHGFGSISGTALEVATAGKLLSVDKLAADVGKITMALAPVIAKAAVVP